MSVPALGKLPPPGRAPRRCQHCGAITDTSVTALRQAGQTGWKRVVLCVLCRVEAEASPGIEVGLPVIEGRKRMVT